jgi:HNH endonuclease/NUMOD4 motif-containing protein
MKERWKLFRHGYYEVSNLGRIYSVRSDKILQLEILPKGYVQVQTCVDYVKRHHYVHVLVAREFIGPRPVGKEVNHKDLNKQNNRWNNLEYKTHAKNIKHAVKHGIKIGKSRPGESNPSAILTKDNVIEIRRLFATGKYHKRSKTLGRKFGVSSMTISRIVDKVSWKNVA